MGRRQQCFRLLSYREDIKLNKKNIAIIMASVCIIALVAGGIVWHNNTSDKKAQNDNIVKEQTEAALEAAGGDSEDKQDSQNIQDKKENEQVQNSDTSGKKADQQEYNPDVEMPILSDEPEDTDTKPGNTSDNISKEKKSTSDTSDAKEDKTGNSDQNNSNKENTDKEDTKNNNSDKDNTKKDDTNKDNKVHDQPIELPEV